MKLSNNLNPGIRSTLLLIAAAVLLGACATTPRTYSNESPLADFSSYQTFSFAEELSTDDGKAYRSLLSQFLIEEVSSRLTARGYNRVAGNADIVVDFAIGEQEKLRSSPDASFGGFYGRGPYPYYGGYYGGYDNDRITQYTESTLRVIMVDARTNSVIWEGASITRITDEVRDNLKLNVAGAIADMFTRFPHYAAGAPALANEGLRDSI